MDSLILLGNLEDNGKLALEMLCARYGVEIDTTQDPRPLWCEKCFLRTHDTSKCKKWYIYHKGKCEWGSENWYNESLWLGNDLVEQGITSEFTETSTNGDTAVPYLEKPDNVLVYLTTRSCIEEDCEVLKHVGQEFIKEKGSRMS